MRLLALEFSSEQRSVAILSDASPGVLGETFTTGGRGIKSFALIEAALQQAGMEREEITALVVGLGPGSYTGIRAGIATAQGWVQATGIPLAAVSSIEGLAGQLSAQGFQGRGHVVIDAQRNEFFLATYDFFADRMQPVTALSIVENLTIRNFLERGERVIGPNLRRFFSAAEDVYPAASAIGRIALAGQSWSRPESIEPIYLREPGFVKSGEGSAKSGVPRQ